MSADLRDKPERVGHGKTWAHRKWPRLGQSPQLSPRDADLSRLALEHSSDGIAVADMRMRGYPIVRINRAFEAITGYSATEAIGKNCRYLQGSDRLQPEIAEIRAALSEQRACSVRLRNYRRDGTMFFNALRLQPLHDAGGLLTHYVAFMRDVTNAAGHDRLTGLLDRYGLLDRLSAENPDTGSVQLLIKLDILGFHDVNNGFGYEVGDALLRAVAARLSTLPAFAVARIGSDTFALAYRLSRNASAPDMVEEVLQTLKSDFLLPGASLGIHVAAGYSTALTGSDPLEFVRQAGAALQRSKAAPTHPPYPFAAADARAARSRIQLVNELQAAVLNDELLFNYQPQIDLRSGELVGVEALLRWNHGAFGLQPPARFIGIAEETGCILGIGSWGLRALASYAAWVNAARAAPIRFALNVSVVEFMKFDMVRSVREVLAQTGCRPEWLTLELTENVMIGEPEHIRRVFGELRQLGVGISIDDFGTGYSNLRYLESFPISEVKIDRSFVHGIADSAAKRVIVEAVVRLGAALDIRVLAEGIETEAERGIIHVLGCSLGQGFLFARPMDHFSLQRILHENHVAGEGPDAQRYLAMVDGSERPRQLP